jgi:hypothetical protein
MTQDTIEKIEGRLQRATCLPDKARAELLDLVAQLKVEMAPLAKTHQEQAQSIASFTDVSTFEATRATKNQKSLEHSISGLESSVSELEATHPQLTGVVSRLANLLSNMGI